MKYVCEKCGKEHDENLALTFKAPFYYAVLSKNDKEKKGMKNDDFCVIEHEEQTDYFIRTVLIQKVIDSCENLEYGLWVSLSKNSFDNYHENYNTEMYKEGYFGYLSNMIPEYDDTLSIRMNVKTQKNNKRPIIEVQSDEDRNHPFVKDFFNGITEEEAKKRIKNMLGKS